MQTTSATLEEYLEAVYKLAERGEVRPSQLADALSVSGATVTATLKRMEAQGLIRRPSGKVALTKEGKRQALSIIRRHRLSERFLVDLLGLSWEEAHEEACRLEHALSPRVTEALEKLLDSPGVCPHGHPIPSAEGDLVESRSVPLAGRPAGSKSEIVLVAEDNEEFLGYLASLGMFPGTQVDVVETAPFRGPLLVRIGRSRYAIGREVAEKIQVHALDDAG